MTRRTALFLIPVLLAFGLFGLFLFRLTMIASGDDPRTIRSALINKRVPSVTLPTLDASPPAIDVHAYAEKPTIVVFFATWCSACRVQHPHLKSLNTDAINLIGIDYKDTDEPLRRMIRRDGNPFDVIAIDSQGRMAFEYGVFAVPETFIIDPQGIIRHKHTGPLTPEIIAGEIQPILKAMHQ